VKTRRPLAILAATALAGLGLTALATPASANTTVTISGSYDEPVLNPGSISGTTVTIDNSAIGGFYFVISPSLLDSGSNPCEAATECSVDGGGVATFTIAQDAIAEDVDISKTSSEPTTLASFTVTYSDGTTPSPAGGPASVIQQFEKPTTGTCDEAQPEGLNWGGASSGGWGESWADWSNEGQGGAVCTRTLAYNTSTGTWQVQ